MGHPFPTTLRSGLLLALLLAHCLLAAPPPPRGYLVYDVHHAGTPNGLWECLATLLEASVLAWLADRTLVIPDQKRSFESNTTDLPIHQILDVAYFGAALAREGIQWVYQDATVETAQGPVRVLDLPQYRNETVARWKFKKSVQFEAARELFAQEHFRTPRVVSVFHCTDYLAYDTPDRIRLRQRLFRGLRASPSLHQVVKVLLWQIRQELRRNWMSPQYACLHMRTEQDHMLMEAAEHRFVPEYEVFRRIQFHPETKKVKAWYVASGNEPRFAPPRTVVFIKKRLLREIRQAGRAVTVIDEDLYVGSYLAMLDFEVCKRATLFVGTSRSIFSENVHLYMKIASGKNPTTLMYNTPDYNLHPFVGTNDCRYLSMDIRCP